MPDPKKKPQRAEMKMLKKREKLKPRPLNERAEMKMLKVEEKLKPQPLNDKTSAFPIKMQGKTPIMKQMLANQKGLQKMTKTEKGREAVKNMGFTKDVDGGMLMKKDYAAMMGGYKAPLKKAALYSKNPHKVGTTAYAEWERRNNPQKTSESFGVDGELISEEKMKEYNDRRELRLEQQAHKKRFREGTGAYAGTYVDRQTGERTRGPVPKFRRKG